MPDKCPICGADSSKIKEVKSKGINTNGNVYTFCYAAVMVIIVAFLLAFVASSLKKTQEANVANDTKGQILSALGYDKGSIDVGAVFAEKVKDKVFADGALQSYEGNFNTTYGSLIKNGELHVFEATAADGSKAYVIPVVGRGLWGGLWGYIAVKETKDEVLGTYFYHESETAGLGARIGEKKFQDDFKDRPIFGEDGNVALTVVKAGTAPKVKPGEKKGPEVDGITGATLTSNGVAAMVKDGLTIYKDFLKGPNCPCDEGEGYAEEESESTNVEQN